MDLKGKSLELKNQLIKSIHEWGNGVIDHYVEGKSALKPMSKYFKNALRNVLIQQDKSISEKIDSVMLFIADENGDYDKEKVFDDMMDIFNTMDPVSINYGFIKGTVGGGSILIELPENPITSFMLGGNNGLRISGSDLEELKLIFTETK